MTVNFTLEEGQKPTKEELEQIRAAAKRPIVFDEDCPELTEEMERAFIAARKAKPYRGPKPGRGGS